jgi:cytochrome c556
MPTKPKLITALTLALSTAIATTALAHTGATGIVKERMDGFKAAKKSMKVLKSAVREADFASIAGEAETLNLWFTQLDNYFPEGSNPKPSEALDLIWEEFDTFSSLGQDSANASTALLRAANEGDEDLAREAFSELAASCKACHDDYRE